MPWNAFFFIFFFIKIFLLCLTGYPGVSPLTWSLFRQTLLIKNQFNFDSTKLSRTQLTQTQYIPNFLIESYTSHGYKDLFLFLYFDWHCAKWSIRFGGVPDHMATGRKKIKNNYSLLVVHNLRFICGRWLNIGLYWDGIGWEFFGRPVKFYDNIDYVDSNFTSDSGHLAKIIIWFYQFLQTNKKGAGPICIVLRSIQMIIK